MKRPRHNVMVVEDDPALRKLVHGYLETLGMAVVSVSDGRAALTHLKDSVPDLICLDLMLPEFSGYDVCDSIRNTPALKDVPILVMSARTLPADRAQALDLGATAYLTKPFNRAEFVKQVRALLPASVPQT